MKLKKIIPSLHLLQKERGCQGRAALSARESKQGEGRGTEAEGIKGEWKVGKREEGEKTGQTRKSFRGRDGSKKGKEKASDSSDGPVLTYG